MTPARPSSGREDPTGTGRGVRLHRQRPRVGAALLETPELNKDAAFTAAERARHGLTGLLPWRVLSIEEQVELEQERLHRKTDDLERYIGLAALQDRNEALFYRLLLDHLEELSPIVYTPTVGQACTQFSHIMRRPRGLWITPDDVDHIPELLRNCCRRDVRLIVVTDNERILGLGDQGAGGMGIPIGKLTLYTAGAGIHPSHTLPISLDVGTDNEALLADPHYLGYPKPRLRGPAYDALVEMFVRAVREVYPNAVLQWEDFKQHNAIRLLDRYRHRIVSFNDDIQGTAAVVAAAVLAAHRVTGTPVAEQRVVIVGAGAAGVGIARLLESLLRQTGASEAQRRRAVVVLDSQGLVYEGRAGVDDDKRAHALPAAELARYGLPSSGPIDLATVVRQVAPTVLVGASGVRGAISEPAVRAMAAQVAVPVVLPLSNPTSASEATPDEVLAWTDGRALVATGSPFEPVQVGGTRRLVGQANNVFVFPGIGLGAIVSGATEISDRMFLVVAEALAAQVPAERLEQGALFPGLGQLRAVSREVALAVAREARDSGLGWQATDEEIEGAVTTAMWVPEYNQRRGGGR